MVQPNAASRQESNGMMNTPDHDDSTNSSNLHDTSLFEDIVNRLPANKIYLAIGVSEEVIHFELPQKTASPVVFIESETGKFDSLNNYIKENQLLEKVHILRTDTSVNTEIQLQLPANRVEQVGVTHFNADRFDESLMSAVLTKFKGDQPWIYLQCGDKSKFNKMLELLNTSGYEYRQSFSHSITHLFLYKADVGVIDSRRDGRTDDALLALKNKLNEANNKYRIVNSNVTSLKEQLAKSREYTAELKVQLENIDNDYNEAKHTIVRLQEEIATSRHAISVSHTERAKYEQSATRANEQCELLAQQLEQLQKEYFELAENNRAQHLYNKEMEDQLHAVINRVQGELNDAITHCERLELFVADANKKIILLNSEIKSLSSKATALETEVDALRKKNNKLHEQLVVEQRNNFFIKNENAKLAESLAIQRELDEVRQFKTRVSPAYLELKDQLDKALSEKTALEQNLQKVEGELSAVQKIAKQQMKLKQKIEALEQKAISLISENNTQRELRIDERSELDVFRALARKNVTPVVDDKISGSLLRLAEWQNERQRLHSELRGLRVACIMDEFTFTSFAPEANFLQLTPAHWARELSSFRPQLLFIESAWRGKHESWGNKVGHKSQELVDIIQWCQKYGIPTVFWNKEDPVHFETFLSTAKLFDYIFTTDIDCIHRYKSALQHDRVYLLPFAAQPAIHNPIEKYNRKDSFCFAGAYYVRYPERTRDLNNFLETLPAYKSIDIYDRNFGKDDENYKFPDEYQQFIVGNLPYSEIDKAYKGYNYAINLNSIKHSQSMFARRVYELLACNTLTVSNYAKGIKLMFGELVACSDSGEQVVEWLNKMASCEADAALIRLHALRSVMTYHCYQDRFGYIAAKASLTSSSELRPRVTVLAYASDQKRYDCLVAQYSQQLYPEKRFLLAVSKEVTQYSEHAEIVTLPIADLKDCLPSQLLGSSGWAAFFVTEDYYGPDYLTDMALAIRFAPGAVVGKHTHWRSLENGELLQVNIGRHYRLGYAIEARRAMVRADLLDGYPLYNLLREVHKVVFESEDTMSVDSFNYCKAGGLYPHADISIRVLSAFKGKNACNYTGLVSFAESIQSKGAVRDVINLPSYTAEQLHRIFVEGNKQGTVLLTMSNQVLEAVSALPDGKHEYLYASRPLPLSDVPSSGGNIHFHLEVSPGLNLQLLIGFLDSEQKKISHQIKHPNKNHSVEVPEGCQYVQLAIRFYAAGACTIKRLHWHHLELVPPTILPGSKTLLLTNHYPSSQDLYRNGFVHSRVKAYQQFGIQVDVCRLRFDEPVSWHEFQGIEVLTTPKAGLKDLLASGGYEHILVHFLDSDMWDVLHEFVHHIPVVVWLHGSEVQPWWRREYNYTTEAALEAAKQESDKRQQFWQQLLSDMPDNLHLVFVSHYFANEVMEDLGFKLAADKYSIIHNPVDTELFSYEPKDPGQRHKVLSIRPYASRKYANDLSVQAVLELSKYPEFEDMEFCFFGDGILFEETLAPLRGFKNVTIEQTFMSQQQIADLHKEYGIFLCPTRMDAQGVSKDEAMSSGLVVVSNSVTAIPEFMDSSCGVLAAAEDYHGMAEGILELVRKPDKFAELSSAAAARARLQVNKNLVVAKEMALFVDQNKI